MRTKVLVAALAIYLNIKVVKDSKCLKFVGFIFCSKTKVYLSDCRVKDKRRHEIRNESKQLKMEKEHNRLYYNETIWRIDWNSTRIPCAKR